MGELVDQTELGRTTQDCGQIHLLQHRLAVAHPPTGCDLQSLGELGRLCTAMSLQQTDHDIPPRRLLDMTLLKHAKGLANAGGHPEEHLQPTTAPLRAYLRVGGKLDGR